MNSFSITNYKAFQIIKEYFKSTARFLKLSVLRERPQSEAENFDVKDVLPAHVFDDFSDSHPFIDPAKKKVIQKQKALQDEIYRDLQEKILKILNAPMSEELRKSLEPFGSRVTERIRKNAILKEKNMGIFKLLINVEDLNKDHDDLLDVCEDIMINEIKALSLDNLTEIPRSFIDNMRDIISKYAAFRLWEEKPGARTSVNVIIHLEHFDTVNTVRFKLDPKTGKEIAFIPNRYDRYDKTTILTEKELEDLDLIGVRDLLHCLRDREFLKREGAEFLREKFAAVGKDFSAELDEICTILSTECAFDVILNESWFGRRLMDLHTRWAREPWGIGIWFGAIPLRALARKKTLKCLADRKLTNKGLLARLGVDEGQHFVLHDVPHIRRTTKVNSAAQLEKHIWHDVGTIRIFEAILWEVDYIEQMRLGLHAASEINVDYVRATKPFELSSPVRNEKAGIYPCYDHTKDPSQGKSLEWLKGLEQKDSKLLSLGRLLGRYASMTQQANIVKGCLIVESFRLNFFKPSRKDKHFPTGSVYLNSNLVYDYTPEQTPLRFRGGYDNVLAEIRTHKLEYVLLHLLGYTSEPVRSRLANALNIKDEFIKLSKKYGVSDGLDSKLFSQYIDRMISQLIFETIEQRVMNENMSQQDALKIAMKTMWQIWVEVVPFMATKGKPEDFKNEINGIFEKVFKDARVWGTVVHVFAKLVDEYEQDHI